MKSIERDWGPWERGVLPTSYSEQQIAGIMTFTKLSRSDAIEAMTQALVCDEVWLNNRFQVNKRHCEPCDGWPAMIHLSIKRRDREPMGVEHFRVLQRIKNDLVGPHNEAVELYPAEEYLVDVANQYHLWILADPRHRFPFGFRDRRMVTGENIGAAVQRPFVTPSNH